MLMKLKSILMEKEFRVKSTIIGIMSGHILNVAERVMNLLLRSVMIPQCLN